MADYRPYCVLLAMLALAGCLTRPGWLAASERPEPEAVEATTETRYGAHIDAAGRVHFVVFAPEAMAVHVLLFEAPQDTSPAHVIPMQQDGADWKIRLQGAGIGPGLLYMYRATGAREVDVSDQYGFSFNPVYPLNDPYAYDTQNVRYTAFFTDTPFVDASTPRYAGGGKSIVYNHTQDEHPGHVSVQPHDLIIYELHVQDYTARLAGLHESQRGTYAGLATSGLRTPGGLAAGLDHLVELGITAVELMPVMEYDEDTGNAAGRLNHWGYMTTNFFAPESRYAAAAGMDVRELKQLIKALHQRHIAVIIDAVYNHTGEGGPFEQDGKLAAKFYNARGLHATRMYKSTADGRFYFNNTGTGNDVDFSGADDTFPKRWATDSLALWHSVYGVDGFRFDLARVLADGSHSAADWVDNAPDFANAHLHAEPWDLGGAWFDFMDNYGYGHHNNRWAKWMGRYRDHMRHFSKSTLRRRSVFKQLIEGRGDAGSGAPASSQPWRSVNFLAVHDGYTLRDCVAVNDSGGSHNCWNSDGSEELRRQRQKLLLGLLLTSQGVPLLLQGDEFGRSKAGARSQDDMHNTYNYESTSGDTSINHVNWIDWRLKDGDTSQSPGGPRYGKELFRWTQRLIRLRRHWTHFRQVDFSPYAAQAFDGGARAGSGNDGMYTYAFEGAADGEPTQLAVIWWGKPGEPDLMVVYNEHFEPFSVTNLGNWSQGNWRILARSWLGEDSDFCDLEQWEDQCPEAGGQLQVEGRSLAILISDNN